MDDRVDGTIGVKAVEDPRRFGVVEVAGRRIVRLVEKPQQFVSNLAIAGVNYIRNSSLLFGCLRELFEEEITTRGEYQLTDAFERMVEQGAHLEVFSVEHWFDCGKPETLLATNRHLLSRQKRAMDRPGSILRPPVYIAPSATIVASVVGPYASIADGAHIEESIVEDSIVGEEAVVCSCLLSGSLVGDHARVYGYAQRLNVGDSSEIHLGGGTGENSRNPSEHD
jgi:glucose-1-phosphate thymidylyltransferase